MKLSMVPLVNIDMLSIDSDKTNTSIGLFYWSSSWVFRCKNINYINSFNIKTEENGIAAICNGGGGASSIRERV